MAAKTITNTENITTQTIATTWTANSMQAPDGTVSYSLNISYSDNKFIQDADGKLTPLVLGTNSHWFSLDSTKTNTILSTPVTLDDGTKTTLGLALEHLLDAEILIDMAKYNV